MPAAPASPAPKPKVTIGVTSIVGWLTSLIGLAPVVWKSVEEGQVAFGTAEKWSALAGVIALAITQLGRYAQSLKL